MNDPRLDSLDEQWCARQDALALGDESSVPGDGSVDVDADAAMVEAWERELAFYDELAVEAAGHPERPLDADELALIDDVLALDAAGPSEEDNAAPDLPMAVVASPDEEPANETSGALRWAVALVAVAAAVVLAVIGLTPDLGLRSSTGSWVAQEDRRGVDVGDALPMAIWLVAESDACGEVEEASVCATAGSEVRIRRRAQGKGMTVELRRGSVTVRGSIDVQTPEGTLGAGDDSHYEVALDAEGVDVRVHSGSLQVLGPDATKTLEPGGSMRLGDAAIEPPTTEVVPEVPEVPEQPESPETAPAPESDPTPGEDATKSGPSRSPRTKTPAPPPDELLSKARTLRGQGDKRGAAKAYAALIDAHPRSTEAQAARVSLGQLRLAAGRHKAALALFSRYLSGGGGSLAEEALWGKIQALAALGRKKALDDAVGQLVRRFPRSVYRSRAEELRR